MSVFYMLTGSHAYARHAYLLILYNEYIKSRLKQVYFFLYFKEKKNDHLAIDLCASFCIVAFFFLSWVNDVLKISAHNRAISSFSQTSKSRLVAYVYMYICDELCVNLSLKSDVNIHARSSRREKIKRIIKCRMIFVVACVQMRFRARIESITNGFLPVFH